MVGKEKDAFGQPFLCHLKLSQTINGSFLLAPDYLFESEYKKPLRSNKEIHTKFNKVEVRAYKFDLHFFFGSKWRQEGLYTYKPRLG